MYQFNSEMLPSFHCTKYLQNVSFDYSLTTAKRKCLSPTFRHHPTSEVSRGVGALQQQISLASIVSRGVGALQQQISLASMVSRGVGALQQQISLASIHMF
jgi:hypothetical protein